jgi:hypothetical protein
MYFFAAFAADELSEVGRRHRSKAFKYYTVAIACFAIATVLVAIVASFLLAAY